MKNDFDFIKDKIENSGVTAPEHMDEDYVLSAIADSEPKAVPFAKRGWARVTAAAASFVLIAGIAIGVAAHLNRKPADIPAVSDDTELIRFTDRDQVLSALKKINKRASRGKSVIYEDAEAYSIGSNSADGAASAASGSRSGTGSHSETYKQVEGVDEPDIIKTDGRYIYAVENRYSEQDYAEISSVCIFKAEPGASEPVCRVTPADDRAATPDEATPDEEYNYYYRSVYINDIFVTGGRLTVICNDSTDWADGGGYHYEQLTRAYVYDVSDADNVRLIDTFTQSGSCTSSRMIGDTLYLISNEYDCDCIPVCGRSADPDELSADCIYSVERPSDSSFLIVSAYDTLDRSADTDSKAILGAGDDIYCNEENLYIIAAEYDRGVWLFGDDYAVTDDDAASSAFSPYAVKTKIFKVSLTDSVEFTAHCEVEGCVDSQYSLDERSGYLRVVTTSRNDDHEDVNNLFVLNGDLDKVGAVTGFAETESVKAVRYVGDVAYVITYEQTDPLFVIDLSAPADPKIMGEVKISGFSTMLVPIDENTVLGIGYNTDDVDYTDMEVTDGVKLALFDVSDKSAPKVLDSRSYVCYDSPVTYNPRALVYNPDRGDYVIPLNYYHYDSSDKTDYMTDDEWDEYWKNHTEQYGGALNFRAEGGRIVETGLYKSAHDRIERCVYVGDTVYMTYTTDSGELRLESVGYN